MWSGRVYIGEDFDGEGFLVGRFSAHWESGSDPVQFEEGPQGVSVEEAIAWGRRRAAVVLVRLGDEGLERSAGVTRPKDDEVGHWPPSGFVARRRRLPDLGFLDRTEQDAPVSWLASIYFFEPAAEELCGGEREQRALVDAVVATPGCELVSSSLDGEVEPPALLPGSRGRTWIAVVVRVAAATYTEAEALVDAVAQTAKSAGDALLPADPRQPGWGLSCSVVPE